jgi:hypothetical protein
LSFFALAAAGVAGFADTLAADAFDLAVFF